MHDDFFMDHIVVQDVYRNNKYQQQGEILKFKFWSTRITPKINIRIEAYMILRQYVLNVRCDN